MRELKRKDNNLIRFSVAILLVFSFAFTAGGGLVEALCGNGCNDHCDDSCETCGDCINCLSNTHMIFSFPHGYGLSDRIHLWNVSSLPERIEGIIATDIDHPPQNLS